MINVEKNFDNEVINSTGITLVDFWAPWCGPCKMFEPILKKAKDNYNNIKFCKFNIEEDNNDLAKTFGIMSIPTIIVFKDGKEIKRNIGLMNENNLNDFLEEFNV